MAITKKPRTVKQRLNALVKLTNDHLWSTSDEPKKWSICQDNHWEGRDYKTDRRTFRLAITGGKENPLEVFIFDEYGRHLISESSFSVRVPDKAIAVWLKEMIEISA